MFFESAMHKVKVVTAEKNQSLTDTEINKAIDELRRTDYIIDKMNYICDSNGRLVMVVIEYIT